MRNVVCLVVDGLGAAALGCYGNTWLETPSLDRLAADSLVLDQATVDRADLMSVYHGWWQGRSSATTDSPEQPTLIEILADAGCATCLLTDDESLATDALATAFDQSIVLPKLATTQAASSFAETHAARFFAAAVDTLAGLEPPYFCWLHWQGMLDQWDAPQSFRERLADEEDPVPPEFVEVPSLLLPADDDPDHLLGIMQAYGGQVMLLDECFGVFYEQFLASPDLHETLFVLTSPRGFPLGEHRVVGYAQNADGEISGAPYSELVHVPCIVRSGDGRMRLARSAKLVQQIDLAPTVLAALLGTNVPSERVDLLAEDFHPTAAVRDHVRIATATHIGIRTPAWHYIEPRTTLPDEEPAAELYVKPDDRTEVNNVASLCPEAAAELKEKLHER